MEPNHDVTTICIDSLQCFPTTWYYHADSPNFAVCSRCFEDDIRNTAFAIQFRGSWLSDRKPRKCRFSSPRLRDLLWKDAVATGNLKPVTDYMNTRSEVADCQGVQGVTGHIANFTWFRPKNNAVPGMVVCEACYQDLLLARRQGANFEPVTARQKPDETWVCGMAHRFISEEYKRGADVWPGFVREAAARLAMPGCPGQDLTGARSRVWFMRAEGPDGCLLCCACYCDQIAFTQEQSKWSQISHEQVLASVGEYVRCAHGQFNISVATAVAHQLKDMSVFRNALVQAWRQPRCDAAGIADAASYTFSSQPRDYGICGACYAAIAVPLGLARFMVLKLRLSREDKVVCCCNPSHPRIQLYMAKVLEAFLTGNVSSFEAYVGEYSSIPVCPRDKPAPNKAWYGWNSCTICPECHHDHVVGTTLAATMQLRGVRLAENYMCELYSPRMRRLYAKACAATPPDPAELLATSVLRRAVHEDIFGQKQRIQASQREKLLQQQALISMSANYGTMGGAMHPLSASQPYGASNIGYGYALQGGIHGAQASVVMAELYEMETTVMKLDERWREAE